MTKKWAKEVTGEVMEQTWKQVTKATDEVLERWVVKAWKDVGKDTVWETGKKAWKEVTKDAVWETWEKVWKKTMDELKKEVTDLEKIRKELLEKQKLAKDELSKKLRNNAPESEIYSATKKFNDAKDVVKEATKNLENAIKNAANAFLHTLLL